MHTENRITIRGDIDHIFAVASAVEAWPRILPHYRWVKVLSGTTTERLVEMAAHRDGFPVRWTARQRLEPHQHRMHFTQQFPPMAPMSYVTMMSEQSAGDSAIPGER